MEGMVGQVPTTDESAKLPVGNWGAFGAFGGSCLMSQPFPWVSEQRVTGQP